MVYVMAAMASPTLARFYIREVSEGAPHSLVVVGTWRSGSFQQGARVSVGCGGLLFAPAVIARLQSRPGAQGNDEITITLEVPPYDDEETSFNRDLLTAVCTQGSTIGLLPDDDAAGHAPQPSL